MYFKTDQKDIDFTPDSITSAYNEGYVLTRLGQGIVNQTRSLRIDLSKFDLSSENRRVLKKTDGLELEFRKLPLKDYSWEIHKMGKDFYTTKFGNDTMSASKIKEMFNDSEHSNMNGALRFNYQLPMTNEQTNEGADLKAFDNTVIGYCLMYINAEIVHYAYPFYDLEFTKEIPNVGLGMMIRAIEWAKGNNKRYIYLGSAVDASAKYKLQFSGLEWWNEGQWSEDIESLKNLLRK